MTMNAARRIGLLALCLVLCASAVIAGAQDSAQDPSTGVSPRPKPAPRSADSATPAGPFSPAEPSPPSNAERLRDPLRQALELMRVGRAFEAVPILESLLAEHPDDAQVFQALTQAYLNAGQPERAVALCRERAQARGQRDPDLWVDLAQCCLRAGRPEEAVEALLTCAKARPTWTIRLLEQLELAVADSLGGDRVLKALEKATRAQDAAPEWKEMLAHLYATTGRERLAVGMLMQADREQKQRGELVFELAQVLAKRGALAEALAACDSALALDPRETMAEHALYEKGGLLARLDRVEEALAAYAEGERRFPEGPLALQRNLARAELLMTRTDDLAGAQAAYEAVIARAKLLPRRERQQPVIDRARLSLAECALRREDFAGARQSFADLSETAAQSDVRENAAFDLAEMLFFEGKFVEAEEAYYQLTDRYPNGNWVNDAFRRVLMLGETRGGPRVEEYARVEYLRRVGRTREALERCRAALADESANPVAAEMRFEEAMLLVDLGDAGAAEAAVDSLIADHPRSRVAPGALFWRAQRAEQAAGENATALYERIILEYPSSFEARRARARVRELRAAEANS